MATFTQVNWLQKNTLIMYNAFFFKSHYKLDPKFMAIAVLLEMRGSFF